MEQKKLIVVYAECGEWDGIYVNGELAVENHNLSSSDWIRIIQQHQCFDPIIETYYVKDSYIENKGNYPSFFTEFSKDDLYQ